MKIKTVLAFIFLSLSINIFANSSLNEIASAIDKKTRHQLYEAGLYQNSLNSGQNKFINKLIFDKLGPDSEIYNATNPVQGLIRQKEEGVKCGFWKHPRNVFLDHYECHGLDIRFTWSDHNQNILFVNEIGKMIIESFRQMSTKPNSEDAKLIYLYLFGGIWGHKEFYNQNDIEISISSKNDNNVIISLYAKNKDGFAQYKLDLLNCESNPSEDFGNGVFDKGPIKMMGTQFQCKMKTINFLEELGSSRSLIKAIYEVGKPYLINK